MKYQVIAPMQEFLAHIDGDDKFPDTLQLDGGYAIERLDKSKLEDAFTGFKDSFSKQEVDELKACTHVITYEYEDSGAGYSGLPKEVLEDIDRIIFALRLVRPTRTTRSIFIFDKPSENTISSREVMHVRVPPVTYPDGDSVFLPPNPRSQFFTNDDVSAIKTYFSNLRYLFATFTGNYQKVLNSIIFFEMGQMEMNYKPRMVILIAGLESLFNSGNEQVGYTIKLRCSYFLERDADKRMELAKEVADIYGLRSLFVHGQGLQNNKKFKKLLTDLNRQKELLVRSEQILRECLQKIMIDRDLIDKFTDVQALSSAFEEIIMGKKTEL